MTLDQIKAAVDAGKVVYWRNPSYRVVRDSKGQYLIGFAIGSRAENYTGLTWRDGVTMNERPEDFYTA